MGQETLEFKPRVKPKKGVRQECTVSPFPGCSTTGANQQFLGVFTGLSVEVSDKQHIQALYENGCFGKGSKSRSAPQVETRKRSETIDEEETLVLELEEAFFLAYTLQVLKIVDLKEVELSWQQFLALARLCNPRFVECFAVYLYLKSKCWVIKSGMKFGAHFVIYKKGLRFYHASFTVIVSTPNDTAYFVSKNIKGLQRIAESAGKDLLLLEVTKPAGWQPNHLHDFQALQMSETIVRRFNLTAYVQKPTPTHK